MSELNSSQAAENPEARPTLAGTVPIFQPIPNEPAPEPEQAPSRWEPGAVLNGRFRIVALVGAGGMGEVYLADDLTLALPVALKFLSSRFTSDPKLLAGLYNEVRLGRQVSHPNVCRIYDIAEVAGAEGAAHPAFISMEYIVGETLDSILHRIGRLPREKGMRAAQELCAGLAAVHDQGLLHRDLKPSNVMIDDRGTARLADFGVAALAQEAGKIGLVGTPGYLPPEVLDGKPATVQSDIYALGLVLYEIFSGKTLFKAMTPAAQKEEIGATDVPALVGSLTEIDPSVKRVIIQCLRPEPAQRPASVRAVAAALAEGAERVRRGRTMVLGALLTLAVIVADLCGLTGWMDRAMYDFRARHFQLFAPPPTDALVHVDIDDAALEVIGRWPWPRSRMAQIVSELDRAKAKVIGLDVVYSEPETERTERQADGSLKTVNDDAVFAQTLAGGNNVLVPVHLPVEMAPPPSPVREKLIELLRTNLEQNHDHLKAALKDAGLSPSDEQFNHEYPFALREAVFARVEQALAKNPAQAAVSPQTLRQQLLPNSFVTGIKTAADDALERALPQVVALRDLQRFSLPANDALGRMVSSSVKEATTPTLTEAARYCGFVDILPSADGVVRSVPLWVQYDNRMMPQAGLALACAYLGVDIQNMQVYPDHLVIPRAPGMDVVVPMHGVNSDARGELGLFMDIPWFGGSNWETMYDYPDHRQSRQHIAINRVWDICEMANRIADNNQAAGADVEKVLALTDIDALNAYHASTRPSYDDADAWNRLMSDALNKVDAGTRKALLDEHFQAQNDAERDFALALRNLMVRAKYNSDQTVEQQRLRDKLRSQIEGKAVLIGPMATSMGDLWRTPLHVQCPGVVIHGVIFNAIVTGYFWRAWPTWMNLTAVLCLGLAATSAATWLSPRKGLVVTAALAVGYLLVNGVVLFAIWRITADAAGPIVAIVGVWLAGSLIRILSAGGRLLPGAVFASLRGKGL